MIKVNGDLIVTDPCYEKDDLMFQAVIPNPKQGDWDYIIEEVNKKEWGKRTRTLTFYHRNIALNDDWTEENSLGVDSGQMYIGLLSAYPEGETGEYEDPNTFYGKCCGLTIGKPTLYGQVDNIGVVSSSGYGDGCYPLFIHIDTNGQVDGVKVQFID